LAQLVLFKLNDIVTAWVTHPGMRRIRALRVLAYSVPPAKLKTSGGDYRFRHAINGREATFALRQRSSDIEVFLQVVRHDEYADVARMLRTAPRPARIIDAGANIGLTTLYLKSFYPDAHVLALEPEAGNFERLRQCVRDNELQDVTLLNEGLWAHDTQLAPDRTFRDGQAWSFTLKEGKEGVDNGIPARSLGSLLALVRWERVDLLKIDIEGGEAKLIRDASFLAIVKDRVDLICVEVHEEAIGRSEVQEALASIGMASVRGGETLIGWRRT
jgi:FkbM family methyltransferase